jgi:acyl-CoA synthetase (NDP forming)
MQGGSGNLRAALDPGSIAILGATENRNKVGGRIVHYLTRFGYCGKIFPINPTRTEVQGIACYPSLEAINEIPDVAVLALGAERTEEAVESCAARGIKCAIVMSSGFAETGEAGRRREARLAAIAHQSGMRLVGPNAQGLANFSSGAVANFSTMFMEVPPKDGPVAIISQSGAASAMPYALLRERGYGVRYLIATGNDAETTTADLAQEVLEDPFIRVVLLYIESVRDAELLARVAEKARARRIAIVALKAGSSVKGMAAANSHTGALASEDAVVSAFFERHGIWRVSDIHELVTAVPLYLQDRETREGRTLVMSHSGAVGVVCADLAERLGLALPDLGAETVKQLREILPSFGAAQNPLDLTAGLLSDSSLFHRALTVLAEAPEIDIVHIGMPVAGEGYDIDGFAASAAEIGARTGKPLAVSGPQPAVLKVFADRGLPVYQNDSDALRAIHQYAEHRKRLSLRVEPLPGRGEPTFRPPSGAAALSESESLALVGAAGIPIAEHRVCRDLQEALDAFRALAGPCVLKGCSSSLPHKSEHGLVWLGLGTEDAVKEAFEACARRMRSLGVEGTVIVARMEKGLRELVIGARRDPIFGPVVLIGDGGKYVEILKDHQLLVPSFSAEDARSALRKLRIWPILNGARGEAPADIDALCRAASALGDLILRETAIAAIDMNPILAKADGAVVLDALVTVEGAPGAATREAAE